MVARATPKWLGQPEGPTLEYKRADVLRHLESISRAVVAMLNAKGGTLVIGVDDAGGVQGVTDAGRQCHRVTTHLLDSIEPRPVGGEIDPEVVRVGRHDVIEIRVTPPKKKSAFAQRVDGRLGFWQRVGATTVALSHAEVVGRLRAEPVATEARARWSDGLEGRPGPILVLDARIGLELGLAEVVERIEAHRAEIDGRTLGWTVLPPNPPEPRPRSRVELGKCGDHKWLVIEKSGHVRFEGQPSFLTWRKPRALDGDPDAKVLWPYAIVEGTVTFLRLLRSLAPPRSNAAVDVELGLWRPEGWRLVPHAPGSFAWEIHGTERWQPPCDRSLAVKLPRVTCRELVNTPLDPRARALLTAYYEELGYAPTDVPFWDEKRQEFRFE